MESSVGGGVKSTSGTVKKFITKNKKALAIAAAIVLLAIVALIIFGRASNKQDYSEGNVNVITTPDKSYEALEEDFNKLKDGNDELAKEYFGASDVYTSNDVADKMLWVSMSFVYKNIDSNGETMLVHVCSFDYNAMTKDYNEAKNTKLKAKESEEDAEAYAQRVSIRNLIDNKYKVCYNVPLKVVNNKAIITEAYKQAITGGWYNCGQAVLEKVECVHK